MRDQYEIIENFVNTGSGTRELIMLKVLLDIRDALTKPTT